MNAPFAIGLAFATGEQLLRTALNQSYRFAPRDVLKGFILELPSFLAFAFLAGIGADWISDMTHNHATESVLAGLTWCICLVIRNVIASQRLWLKGALSRGRYWKWQSSVLLLCLVSIVASTIMFLFYHDSVDVAFTQACIVSIIAIVIYLGFTSCYVIRVINWEREQCREDVSQLLRFYCQKSPDNGNRISKDPSTSRAQSSEYFINKYFVAYSEQRAGQQCVCLENQLVEKFQSQIELSEAEIRAIVRETVTRIASEYDLEYRALTYIVAKEPAFRRAKDIIEKSPACGFIGVYNDLRAVVSRDGKLLDVQD